MSYINEVVSLGSNFAVFLNGGTVLCYDTEKTKWSQVACEATKSNKKFKTTLFKTTRKVLAIKAGERKFN